MTASTVKSTRLTDVQTKGALAVFGNKGDLHLVEDVITVATTSIDEANDIILMLPLRTDAIVKSLKLFNEDLDSHATPALVVNVGLAHGLGTGTANGTAIDVDLFASSITTLQAANLVGVEILFESGDITLSDSNKPLWELAGLSNDPGGFFAVQIKVGTAAATAAAGKLKLQALVI